MLHNHFMKRLRLGFVSIGLILATVTATSLITTSQTSLAATTKQITTKNVKGSMKGVSLRVGTSGVFAPFSYYSSNGKRLVGYDIDLLKQLQGVLGYQVKGGQIKVEDYAPLITSISEKKLDVVAAALCATSERKKVMTFTNTYLDSGQMLMVNKTKKTGIKSIKDLKGKTVAVEKGTASHTYASKHLTSATIQAYDKISGAFQALESGKVDAVIQDEPNCVYYLKVHKNSQLKMVGKEFNQGQAPYAIGLTKHSKYQANFNAALKVLQKNGTMTKLNKKWVE